MHMKKITDTLDVSQIDARVCNDLKIFFFDIDGTITDEGMITAPVYSNIWKLVKAGIQTVPVTGRPAGWCDHIARMWPVRGIIGENGAFYYCYDRDKRFMIRRYLATDKDRKARDKIFDVVANKIMSEVPGSRIAADQPFRISDLAIDYREDTGPLGDDDVKRICRLLTKAGLNFKISDIHINAWYGDYDKLSCLKRFLLEQMGKDISEYLHSALFIGDSPNDEPLFKGLKHTVGVANIRPFLPHLTSPPRYISRFKSAKGFCESVKTILGKRSVS